MEVDVGFMKDFRPLMTVRCSFAASLSPWGAEAGRSQVRGLFVGPDYENVSGQSRQLNKTPSQNKNWKEGWAYSGPEFV